MCKDRVEGAVGIGSASKRNDDANGWVRCRMHAVDGAVAGRDRRSSSTALITDRERRPTAVLRTLDWHGTTPWKMDEEQVPTIAKVVPRAVGE